VAYDRVKPTCAVVSVLLCMEELTDGQTARRTNGRDGAKR
jgi:hypothetical protein